MKRWIDAELLKNCYVGTNALDGKADYMSIRKMIDIQPSVDVENIITQIKEMFGVDPAYHGPDAKWAVDRAVEIVRKALDCPEQTKEQEAENDFC